MPLHPEYTGVRPGRPRAEGKPGSGRHPGARALATVSAAVAKMATSKAPPSVAAKSARGCAERARRRLDHVAQELLGFRGLLLVLARSG